MLSKKEQVKLGFAVLVLGFLFWQIFWRSATRAQNFFDKSNSRIGQVLGIEDEREPTALEKSIEKSGDFWGLAQAGKKFLDDNNLELAEKTFSRAVALNPAMRDGHYLLGYIYLKIYEKYGDYVSENPDIFIEQTNLQKARLSLLRAQNLDPNSEKIQELLTIVDSAQK